MSLKPKQLNIPLALDTFIKHIREIYESQSTCVSGMDLFQMVYDLCNAFPKSCNTHLHQSISTFLETQSVFIRERILNSCDILTAYNDEWTQFQLATNFTNIVWYIIIIQIN